jgi:hypothetical protein
MISPFALLCPFLGFLIVPIVIILVVRRIWRSAPRTPRTFGRTPPQLAPDGFWLDSFEPSSIVHYHYWTAGVRYSGQITYQLGAGGRQFVYTGARPDRVDIIRVIGPSDDYAPDPLTYGAAAGVTADFVVNSIPDPPAPPQFPTAY